MVKDAGTIEDMGGLYGARSEPCFWIRQRPNLRKMKDEEGLTEEDEDEALEELDEDAEIQALQPIAVHSGVEDTVAIRASKESPAITHQHECPDCGERFSDWESCREHLVRTGHLDVSLMGVDQAKARTQPVRWRCLECFEGFTTKAKLEQHLKDSGHLKWASERTKATLCKPQPIPDLDARPQKQEQEPVKRDAGFFRSLGTSLWTASEASDAAASKKAIAEERVTPKAPKRASSAPASPPKAPEKRASSSPPKASPDPSREASKVTGSSESTPIARPRTPPPKAQGAQSLQDGKPKVTVGKPKHRDKKTEALIAASGLPPEAQDSLRSCAAFDARVVLDLLEQAIAGKQVPVKPLEWVQGKLRMLKNQKAITPRKLNALLLKLDDLQLKVSELRPFQRLTLQQACAVVETLRKRMSRKPGQDPSVQLKAAWPGLHVISIH